MVGGARVEHLIARLSKFWRGRAVPFVQVAKLAPAFVHAEYCLAQAILHALDNKGREAPAAVHELRIGRHHALKCRLARTKRISEIRIKVIHHAEAFGEIHHALHADVLREPPRSSRFVTARPRCGASDGP